LLNMKNTDNMSEICNMYLCASYVTEMGWQLDDLQVESFRHAYICAALKARNDTLAIQNETLETLKEVRERQKNTLETQRKILQAQKNTLKS
jgi:vacuolar-type H+-ATPase subunit I/STV1